MPNHLSARLQKVISERPIRLVVDGVDRLAMPLSVVKICDEFLRSVYGIRHYDSWDEWWERGKSVRAEIGADNWLKFRKLFDKRETANKKLGYIPEKLDPPFYDAIAHGPLSGWVHSLKRSLILDGAMLAQGVYRDRNMTGPILEIGGHIGYHSAWLATATGASLVSVEACEPAVQAARCISPSDSVEYIATRWHQYLQSAPASFQCVVAFDSVTSNEEKFLRAVKPCLAPDGLVLMTLSGDNSDDVIVKAQGLGFQSVTFNQIGDIACQKRTVPHMVPR